MRTLSAFLVLAVAPLTLGAQAGNRPARRPATEAQITAAIDAANARWQAAVLAGNAAGFAAEFADDATFAVPMAPPARGRAAIERSTREWLAVVRVDSIALTRSDLRFAGDVVMETGSVRTATTPRRGGASTVDVAHYLTIWQRQPDGAWRIVRDMTTPATR